jgi:hypothetical protein
MATEARLHFEPSVGCLIPEAANARKPDAAMMQKFWQPKTMKRLWPLREKIFVSARRPRPPPRSKVRLRYGSNRRQRSRQRLHDKCRAGIALDRHVAIHDANGSGRNQPRPCFSTSNRGGVSPARRRAARDRVVRQHQQPKRASGLWKRDPGFHALHRHRPASVHDDKDRRCTGNRQRRNDASERIKAAS